VVEILSEQISPDARIIWGAQVDPSLEDTIKTMIVATGVDSCQISGSNKSAIGNGAKKYGIDFVG
jgi:cell division protein FtsZ